MNTERILQLADVIEKTPHKSIDAGFVDVDTFPLDGFNMRTWHCGSVGCLGGWTEFLFKSDGLFSARDALNLTPNQSRHLFLPEGAGPWHRIKPTHAAAVLRHLATTGEVDWSVTPAEMA